MDMYRIVFCGELLEGYAQQDVSKAAALRFRLAETQLARMFSGERVVLKKAVSDEAAQPYLAELARMGMRARLERLPQVDEDRAEQLRFKVVFWGRTVPGYGREQVMRAVPRRLPVDQAGVVRMFSGGKVVLKRGVNAETGARYVAELARIGMQVELEVEVETLTRSSFNATASQIAVDDQGYGNFMQTQVDFLAGHSPLDTDVMGAVARQEMAPVMPSPAVRSAPPMARAVQSERLASVIEAAYVEALGKEEPRAVKGELRCQQCGHRQASGKHCSACGCAFPAVTTQAPSVPMADEMTRSLQAEMLGIRVPGVDGATLMREMRAQQSGPATYMTASRRLRKPLLLGSAACLAALGGWLLLAPH